MKPNELREAIDTWVQQAYVNGNLDTHVDSKDAQGWEVCSLLILDAVLASLPKDSGDTLGDQWNIGYDACRDEVIELLQQAKSANKGEK